MASSSVTVCSGLRDALGAGVLADLAGVDRILHRGDDELDAEVGDDAVAELDELVEVVSGVDVHDRERHTRRPEGAVRQVQHHHGILAAGEQQHGPLELGGYLADDRDRFVLQLRCGRRCRCGIARRA